MCVFDVLIYGSIDTYITIYYRPVFSNLFVINDIIILMQINKYNIGIKYKYLKNIILLFN